MTSNPLGSILKSCNNGDLGGLVRRARELGELTDVLSAALPGDCDGAILAANVRDDGTLVVIAASSAWANRLRYEAELLLAYEGVYEQPRGRKVTISAKEQSLLMEMPGVPNFQLYPQSDTEFFLKDFDPIIAFSKSEEGDPVLEIIEGENTIVCKKIE